MKDKIYGKKAMAIGKPLDDVVFPEVKEERIYRSSINRVNKYVPGYKALLRKDDEHIYKVVTDDYIVTKHEEMLDTVKEAMKACPEYGQPTERISLFDNGGKMRAQYVFEEVTVEIGRGDKLHPQVEIFNSYDLGWSRRILFGAYRLVCSNGLVIGEKAFQYYTTHRSEFNSEVVKQFLIDSMENFSDQKRIWEQWLDKITTPVDYERVMDALPLTKTDISAIEEEVEISSDIRIHDLKVKTLTWWIFFNILCQYVTHHVESHLKRAALESAIKRQFGR